MAEGQHVNAISAAFPAPPPFYKHFTPENLEKAAKLRQDAQEQEAAASSSVPTTAAESSQPEYNAQGLQYLLPPAPPASGKFRVFGEAYDLANTIRSLPDQGIEQLYPPAPNGVDHPPSPTTPNQADKLIHITRSILLSFLELTDILAKNPTLYGQKIDDLTTLFHNAHHLLNEYRPHQARETLIAIVEGRVRKMREEIRGVEEMERRVGEMLAGLGEVQEKDGAVPDVSEVKRTEQEEKRVDEARKVWNALQGIEI